MKTKITVKRATAFTIVILLVIGGYMLYRSSQADAPATTDQTINYNPPTDQEKQSVDEHKKEIPDTSTPNGSTTNNGPGKRQVTPVIVDAGQYGQTLEVRSYVPDIIEDGGTCTLSLSMGNALVTRHASAQPDATNTGCPKFSVPTAELSGSGNWQVTISYESGTAKGASNPQVVEIR